MADILHYPATEYGLTTTDWQNETTSTAATNFTVCPAIDISMSNTVLMVLYSAVCIIGLMGNTLVIYVVLRFSNMQTVTNMYILNLAIADECFLIGIPFLLITMNLRHWMFGDAMCKAYMVSTSVTQFTSSIFLFIMAADRYIAICHHISSPKYRTAIVSRIVSVFAWVASALIMLPSLLYATVIRKDDGRVSCAIVWPAEYGHLPGYSFTTYSLFLGFVVPLCFIMLFYCLVIKKLREVANKTNKTKGKRRSHRKVTKLVLTVITVYILCWLPYWLTQLILITTPSERCSTKMEVIVFLLVGCLGYSNSAINPVLYAYLSDNFKKSFLKACTCASAIDSGTQLRLDNNMPSRRPIEHSSTDSKGNTSRNQRLFRDQNTTTTTTGISTMNPSPPHTNASDLVKLM